MGIDFTLLENRALAAQAVLPPSAVFSHTTAAALLGAPLGLVAAAHSELHVTVPGPVRSPRVNGITAHQRRAFGTVLHGRVRVIAPADAWCDLGEFLAEHDVIAVGDFFVTGNAYEKVLPQCTVDDLRAAVVRRRGTAGVRVCARAVGRVAEGPLSRPESFLRLLLVDAGVPAPRVNFSATDHRGSFIAMPDLAWPEVKVALEYEGDHHRGVRQFRDDIRRVEKLVDHGWLVIKVSADDVFDRPRELVDRVVRRLASRGLVARDIRLPVSGLFER